MKQKNRNILIGAILMISGAGLALILTFIYGSVLDSSLAEQVTAMTQQDAAFAAELEASGMTLDALIEGMQGTLSILLGLGAALNVVKIVVGVLGIRKAAEPATFFVVWGAVLLLLGVLGMMFSGVASVLGLCDLAGGVFGPALFLWGGVQNKRAFQRMLKEERAAEEQAVESAWPPVRKGYIEATAGSTRGSRPFLRP